MELTMETSTQPPPTSSASTDSAPIEEWLSLTDYAAKYRVSVSTLRRRIKTNQISHRFVDGKYLLLDSRPAELDHGYHQQERMDVALDATDAADFLRDLGRDYLESSTASNHDEHAAQLTKQIFAQSSDPNVELKTLASDVIASDALLEELKRAYMRILQEKEEQIIQLKAEITDLQTFVRVLEDDNHRMRSVLSFQPKD